MSAKHSARTARGGQGAVTAEELEHIAKSLDPKARRSGVEWSLRCPAHDDTNPSLSIGLGARGAIVVRCHSGCSQDAVVQSLKERGLWPSAGRRKAAPRSSGRMVEGGGRTSADGMRATSANRTFERGRDIAGTAAQTYLTGTRMISADIVALAGSSLRFVERLALPSDVKTAGSFGGLIAAIHDREGKLIAVQRQWLTASGEKAPFPNPKRFLGPASGGGCYVGLKAGEALSGRVMIAEGMETLLSAMQVHDVRQGIAAFTAPHLGKLKLPPPHPGVEILIAQDAGGAGESEAERLRKRLEEEGHRVVLLSPPKGMHPETQKSLDWNDVVMGLGAAPGDAGQASPDAEHPDAWMPNGFRRGRDGWIERLDEDADGNAAWRRVCTPIRVLAQTRDQRGRSWGFQIAVRTPDGCENIWAPSAALFVDDGLQAARELAGLGLRTAPGRRARADLIELITESKTGKRAWVTPRLGWIDNDCRAFVLADGRVLGEADVVFQRDGSSSTANEMRSTGSLEAWRESVSSLAVGNPILMFAICVAFGGPLLAPLGLDGGGFHLRGVSSRGKTSALRLAASVWGAPGFVGTWRATANGIEGAAAVANGSLLVLDELGELHAKEASQVAYMLANGRGKERMNASAELRPTLTWKTLFLSSGEISLADKLREAGRRSKAGERVRMIDIPATERSCGAFDDLHGCGRASEFAERISAASGVAFGHAGPAFVERLIGDVDRALQFVRASVDRFVIRAKRDLDLPASVDGQVERAFKRFALVAAAGELATCFGLTSWPADAATTSAIVAAGLWLEARGGAAAGEVQEVISCLREFLVRHGDDRFAVIGAPSDKAAVRNRAGWRNADATRFFIPQDVWRSEVFASMDGVHAARVLQEHGFLERADGKNLMVRLPASAVPGRPRAYAVRAEILGCDHLEAGDAGAPATRPDRPDQSD